MRVGLGYMGVMGECEDQGYGFRVVRCFDVMPTLLGTYVPKDDPPTRPHREIGHRQKNT